MCHALQSEAARVPDAKTGAYLVFNVLVRSDKSIVLAMALRIESGHFTLISTNRCKTVCPQAVRPGRNGRFSLTRVEIAYCSAVVTCSSVSFFAVIELIPMLSGQIEDRVFRLETGPLP